MHVNCKDIEAGGSFPLLPSGEYAAKLISHEERYANSGNPCVGVRFEIVNSKFAGKMLFDNFTLIESCLWKLKQFALAVNYPATEAEEGFDTNDLFIHAMNEIVMVNVSKEMNTNPKTGKEQERNKIDGYRAMPDDPVISEEDAPFADNPPPPEDDVPFA